jgi:hypothetical protein
MYYPQDRGNKYVEINKQWQNYIFVQVFVPLHC